MSIPPDYVERVYAGVLGKIIGVYLGRPFEGWGYDSIMERLGEIQYYVHEKLNAPLIVTDDDISGTFTFLRALPDYDNSRDLTPEQIGQTWLNYLIEKRTVLWWGGVGNSTEHTAYQRLKSGIPAPDSGSIATNGKVVAEQIGAQIFIDGWGMVAPGDPEFAADLARRAASVSHDGEAIYGAQVIAAMEAQAFIESDINKLIDTAIALIPQDSVIYRMIGDIRYWHSEEKDWRKTREKIAANYGYDKYGGNCHMVPNHGLIIHSLLHGEGDFQKSLMIVNTCGWDTDCNSGNVGCLLGIRNGLAGIEDGPDWRGPVADRMYLPTADGGRAVTDAVTETYHIVNIAGALAGLEPIAPKQSARFHFDLPGAVQGFQPEDSIETRGTVEVENVEGHSTTGQRSLAIHYHHVAPGRLARVATSTFVPPDALNMGGYGVVASPTLYPGQTVRARVVADDKNHQATTCRLYLRIYGAQDKLTNIYGPEINLEPGSSHEFTWPIEDTSSLPIVQIGVEVSSEKRADGTLYLDYLTWDGPPNVVFKRPVDNTAWQRAWVNGVDHFESHSGESFRLIQDEGRGLLMQGARDWTDYQVSAAITPHLVASAGIAARVQGMRRYYALLLCDDGKARLVKALDGQHTLAQTNFPWKFGEAHDLNLQVAGNRITGCIDGRLMFDVRDTNHSLSGGGIALLCEEGRMATDEVRVQPIS
ncbi:MAG: ADP-ribosylglycohydrolase family protein [Abitibacteriaceae bacterium]|nr:ADP-ribosylglycohydrolase family protein [Abditibacteriaceae bacterium]